MRYELIDCPNCRGWGMVSGYREQDFIGAVECTRCHGSGKRRRRCDAPEAICAALAAAGELEEVVRD